mgnify:CR=1 FL=1
MDLSCVSSTSAGDLTFARRMVSALACAQVSPLDAFGRLSAAPAAGRFGGHSSCLAFSAERPLTGLAASGLPAAGSRRLL